MPNSAPPPQVSNAPTNGIIHQEEQKFGVPQWIGDSIIWTETGGTSNPASHRDGSPYWGLLQLDINGPYFHAGDNPTDATTNLERGLPYIEKAVKQAQAQGMDTSKPNWNTLAYVETHSGHPTFTGDWAGQEAAFKNGYENVNASFPDVVGSGVYNSGVPGVQQAGAVGGALTGGIGSIGDLFSWVGGHPGYVAVIVAAAIVMLGTGFHIVNTASGGALGDAAKVAAV